jgi:hypothetical protein
MIYCGESSRNSYLELTAQTQGTQIYVRASIAGQDTTVSPLTVRA